MIEREKTIGIVTFKREGQAIKYLLLHHGGPYWNFPKGRKEKGETDMESALRELQEETGIADVQIVDGFIDEYNYDFDSEINDGKREKVYKRAIFYLGDVGDAKVKVSDEHLTYDWFDFETALKRMYFQEGQNLLKRAHRFLLTKQDFVL